MVDAFTKPTSHFRDEDSMRRTKYDEAWNLGKRHRLLELDPEACLYPYISGRINFNALV